MSKKDLSKRIKEAIDPVIVSRFNEIVASGGEIISPEEELAHNARQKFYQTLNEEQRAAFIELENLETSAEVTQLKHYFILAFYDGISTGRDLF